jgi:hypothetical protein
VRKEYDSHYPKPDLATLDGMTTTINTWFFLRYFLFTKAVISLPQYADTQMCKRRSDIALQRFYLKMTHLHICFVKQVFFLSRYADTHTKQPFFYLRICIFVFEAQIEDPFSLSFWHFYYLPRDFLPLPHYFGSLPKISHMSVP